MIIDKFDRNENPDWDPDLLVEVTFTEKAVAVKNGYRPNYKVNGDYLTSTHHWFIETGKAEPNQPTKAFVKLITPEAYSHCLDKGMVIEVGEGSRKIGTAKVIEIYNVQLQKNT
ncbi:hypothetical protein [Microbulbifer thermotolerans]|uniref:hypothetical protein n=1 Tax=Microbulbifer thermotolerans TaxID=252514 RepID=UPI00224AF22C|nr:hypothetical protein [Microbulbifer thermotolerans]MCX2779297.1 hypothetical protein [Microbulbifer thermotolerans]MCX2806684.1 hypothetical protein [Microbulbifer thermotolerans]